VIATGGTQSSSWTNRRTKIARAWHCEFGTGHERRAKGGLRCMSFACWLRLR
jgi:hypothetical protein